MKKTVLLGLVLILGQIFATGAAMADSMTWKFRSHHANIVDVQLYASARNNVWPGNGQVWSLKDYNAHSVQINCVRGEKVCYGAWVRGTESSYWGGGRNNRKSCTSCCYICGSTSETPVINLNR
jgi:hypothetical protein